MVAVQLEMTSRLYDQITCNIIQVDHMIGSYDHDITIGFPLRRELCQMYGCRYKCSLINNLSTYWKTKEENREINENILAL